MKSWYLRNRREIIDFLKLGGIVYGMCWLLLVASAVAAKAGTVWMIVVVSSGAIFAAAIISFYCFMLSTIRFGEDK